MASSPCRSDEGRRSPRRVPESAPGVRRTRVHRPVQSAAASHGGEAGEPRAGVQDARHRAGRLPEGAHRGDAGNPARTLMPREETSGSAARRDGTPPRIVPILYFAIAHAALLTALAVVAFRPDEASGFFYQPRMVALVHLVTLGWITGSILGSLYVIGPMALRTPMP